MYHQVFVLFFPKYLPVAVSMRCEPVIFERGTTAVNTYGSISTSVTGSFDRMIADKNVTKSSACLGTSYLWTFKIERYNHSDWWADILFFFDIQRSVRRICLCAEGGCRYFSG